MFIVAIISSEFATMLFSFILSESGRMVDPRGVPLLVTTVWAGDSLVNRHKYTFDCGLVWGQAKCSLPSSLPVLHLQRSVVLILNASDLLSALR